MKYLLSGNEATARGAYEAGLGFASAYPGTPSTEILENLGKYNEIISEWAPNEKVAAEAAIGASIAGVRSIAAMKHVGVNVAADPLFTFAYTGVNGGMVLVSADDPSMHSSQNEQDNRHYARSMRMPMFEPSNSLDCYEMIKEAYKVSEKYKVPVMFRMTTRVCHSKSLIQKQERIPFKPIPYVKNRLQFDCIPALSKQMRLKMVDRELNLKEYSENCPFNKIEYFDKKIGIITNGVSYEYAKEVFGENASYFKVGFSNPLPLNAIKTFANNVDTLYVIEELDPFMEMQLKAFGINCIGKKVIPEIGELNPNIIAEAVLGIKPEITEINKDLLVPRPPTLCAGCPHRPFFYDLGKRKNTVMIGDIGCYALGGAEPLNAKDLAICMGSAFSIGHGMKKAFDLSNQDKKIVAYMGDSTFFHTGINSLIETLYNNSNIIACILDNRITGMTGHQENPGSGYNLKGEPANEINIENVCKSLGAKNIKTVNPMDLKAMKETMDWAYSINDGPAIVITRWPCALKKYSKEDIKEFGNIQSKCVVDHEKCIGCKKCISTGCPALSFDKDIKKTTIDPIQCVGCEVCLQVCPVNAISKEEK